MRVATFFIGLVFSALIAFSQPLRVGMELSYPPFEMTDAEGNPAGVSVEIAEALGEYLDRPVRIVNIPFQGLIPALRTGKIDLVLSSMTRTEERARAIDFSNPYLTTGLTLLVGNDSGIDSINDLSDGKVVAVKQGTTGHLYATQNLPGVRLLVLEKESVAVLEVVQGKADAFIYDQMSTFKNWQRHQETTNALLDPFRKEYWAIGVRKGNKALLEEVNRFLAYYEETGGFERLGDRYLAEQKEAFAKMGYPFVF
ncbi:MAG: transporter substrate-binding domain-containing protein [Verrucomicrobiota bacterium]